VEVELAGYNIIGYLLKEFVYAVMQPGSAKARKLRNLIPAQFAITDKPDALFGNLQSVTDFIAGMTDLYAVDMYQKMTGTKFV
jgi:dGTPase